jgi:hypothetical protein
MKIATCFVCYVEDRLHDGYRLFFNTYNYNRNATIVVLTPSKHFREWQDFLSPFKNIKLFEVNYITDDAFTNGVISRRTKQILQGNNAMKYRSGGMKSLLPLIYPNILSSYYFVGGIEPDIILSQNIPNLENKIENYYTYNATDRSNLFLAKSFTVKKNKDILLSAFEKYVSIRGNSLYFENFVDPEKIYDTAFVNTESKSLVYADDPEIYKNIQATGIADGVPFSAGKTYTYIALHDIDFSNENLGEIDWEYPLNFCLDQGELTYYNRSK